MFQRSATTIISKCYSFEYCFSRPRSSFCAKTLLEICLIVFDISDKSRSRELHHCQMHWLFLTQLNCVIHNHESLAPLYKLEPLCLNNNSFFIINYTFCGLLDLDWNRFTGNYTMLDG
ncbi:hypothetical protein CFP56_031449 [Quercus suber]|uniref:Uncharacterized protein n=1 Tax=Quercus suber TaxID=58331 RepID=A0AAW0LTN0_QUESU